MILRPSDRYRSRNPAGGWIIVLFGSIIPDCFLKTVIPCSSSLIILCTSSSGALLLTCLLMDAFCTVVESLAKLGQASLIIPPEHVIDVPYVLPIASQLGLDMTVMKYILGMFLAFPAAIVLRFLPNSTAKHLYSSGVGILLMQWIYRDDWIHSLISIVITYLLCLIAPRKHIHVLVFAWAMGYMTAMHIYRMYVCYMCNIFDFTGTQMVLTMKLTSFAFNLYDGTVDTDKVFNTQFSNKKQQRIYEVRRRFAITSMPSLLEFCGYMYCFTCLLAGPAFEYSEYIQSITLSKYHFTSESKDALLKKLLQSSLLPSIRTLALALFHLVMYLSLIPHYPLRALTSVTVLNLNPLQRMLYAYLAVYVDRCKFYFVWKLAESTSILGGFGYTEGSAGTSSYTAATSTGWNGISNVDILQFETSYNMQSLTRHWNKYTQGWLEKYTYNRTGQSLLLTYFVSGFWHGLYPSYYFMFLSLPLLTQLERQIRLKINPLILKPATPAIIVNIYWFLCRVCTMVSATYVSQVYTLQSYENSMSVLGSYYFLPHIFYAVVLLLLMALPTPSKSITNDKKED